MAKDTIIKKEMQRALAEAEQRESFITSNYNIYMLALLFLVLGSIISAMTEGWHVHHRSGSLIITVIVVLAIELSSITMGTSAINDLKAGVLSSPLPHQVLFAVKLCIYIGVTYFSITLTIEGAPAYYYQQQAEREPPILISEDSIRQVYTDKMTALQVDIDAQRNTRWKGSITRDANKNLSGLYDSRTTITEDEKAAIAEAKAENAEIVAAWEAQTAENQGYVKAFAGLGEIIKIVSIIIIAVFKQGRDDELGIHTVERKLQIDIDGDGIIGTPGKKIGFDQAAAQQNQQAGEIPSPTPRRPIGFILPNPSSSPRPTPSPNRCPPVPTGPKDDFLEHEEEILIMAKKYAKGSRQKWENKLKLNQGTEKTNIHHMTRWERIVNAIDSRLKEVTNGY